MSLRRFIAISDHWAAKAARRLYYAVTQFSVPAPRALTLPLLRVFLAARSVYYFVARVFVCEPLFKAYCAKFGRNLHTSNFVHYIVGAGDLIIGDNVLVDGKCSIAFAARYSERPELRIGDNCYIGHQCSFTVGERIVIGRNCLLAARVNMLDSPGHPTDPAARLAGSPAPPEAVREIIIGDNVWIGTGATILPGTTIGDGSVVGTAAVVSGSVPPNTLVAGNPARMVRSLESARAFSTTDS